MSDTDREHVHRGLVGVYYLLGIPADLFVPIFAVGRVPGWPAQVREQYEHNILIRPLMKYEGAPERPFVPLGAR